MNGIDVNVLNAYLNIFASWPIVITTFILVAMACSAIRIIYLNRREVYAQRKEAARHHKKPHPPTIEHQ